MTIIKILNNGPLFLYNSVHQNLRPCYLFMPYSTVWYLYSVFVVFIFAFCRFLQEYFLCLKLQMKAKFQTLLFIQTFWRINCNMSNCQLEKIMFNLEKPAEKLLREIQLKHEDVVFACFFTEQLCNSEIKSMMEQKNRRNQHLK